MAVGAFLTVMAVLAAKSELAGMFIMIECHHFTGNLGYDVNQLGGHSQRPIV